MPADAGGGAAVGQRRGRPEVAALFVTDKAGFSTGIADWIIIPRGKPHLVGIFDPGVSEAALRDDGSEVPVRQHIYPRRRRGLPARGDDHILPTVAGESTQPVEENQIAGSGIDRWGDFGAVGSAGRQARDRRFQRAATVQLALQGTATVGDDSASDRLQEEAILTRYVFHRPYEDAAWPVRQGGLDTGDNQPHDLVLEQLPVTCVILVPYHQVHRQSFQAPVGVGLYELAH